MIKDDTTGLIKDGLEKISGMDFLISAVEVLIVGEAVVTKHKADIEIAKGNISEAQIELMRSILGNSAHYTVFELNGISTNLTSTIYTYEAAYKIRDDLQSERNWEESYNLAVQIVNNGTPISSLLNSSISTEELEKYKQALWIIQEASKGEDGKSDFQINAIFTK